MIINPIIPYIPNVSLVSFYRNQPPQLTNLIQQLQNYLLEQLQEEFEPYPKEQIHGTLIGYEGIKTDRGIINQWFLLHRNEERYINISPSIDYIYHTNLLPLKIRLGGYHPNINYGFLSQNKSLFDRSFQFLNNMAILRGWAIRGEQVLLDVYKLRLGFQKFNLLHKYHPKPDSLDNDFYLRIGHLKVKPSDEKLRMIENEIRNLLKTELQIDVSVDIKSLNFVRYQDTSLTLETTKVVPLKKARLEQIELLYS